MQDMCNICFLTDVNLYGMTTTELKYYQNFVTKLEFCLNMKRICVYCKSIFNRINKFAEKCQISQDFLLNKLAQESDMILQMKNGHNLFISDINHFYMGPDENDGVKSEDNYEDDIPLVMLSQNSVSEFPGDSDDHNDQLKEQSATKNKRKKKSKGVKIKKDKSKKEPVIKEGFSSRMVQETDEYIVIKLTKEQVLAEMKENEMADKYKMAPYKCEKCVKGFNFEDVLEGHMEKHLPKNGPFLCDICTQYCPSAVSLRGHLKSHTTRYKCKVCHIVRLSRQHVLEHFRLDHTDSAVSYRCTQCTYTTKKRTVMQRHVRLHSSSEPHACHQCGKLYKSRESLRVHIMRHDNTKHHKCDVCSRRFIYATQLKKHVLSVHIRKDYYCVECDIKFKSMYTLKQHFQRAKRHRDSSSYKYACSWCPARFVSAATLATHGAAAHGAAARAACGRCGRRYSGADALRLHLRRAHADVRPPAAPCPLCDRSFSVSTHGAAACGRCGRRYSGADALRLHLRRAHADVRPPAAPCPLCDRSFSVSTHGAAACGRCGRRYSGADALRLHLRRAHADVRPPAAPCPLCDRSFSVSTHGAAACGRCGRRYSGADALRLHLRRAHADVRPPAAPCPLCDRSFSVSTHGAAACGRCGRRYSGADALRLHLRRAHADVRPPAAPCPLCDRSFSRKSVLRIHMRTHTGEKPHACECGASFSQPAALRAHRAAKHKEQVVDGGLEES